MRARGVVAFVVLLAPMAWGAEKIDVSNASITCKTVIGIASITPALAIGGTATSTVMRVKGSVAGCTVTGPPSVSILSGKVSGKVGGTSNECVTLFAPLSGTITMKWKTDKTTPIFQTSSTMNVTNVSFGGFVAPWGASYGQFSLGVSGVTGAFTGGDDGATSSNVSITNEDIGQILAECGSPAGLEKLNTGLGQITLR